jgi:hypothetical protein
VHIHFDFENYKPDLMVREGEKTFVIWRMLPPGKSFYFFTFNGEEKIAKNHKIMQRKIQKKIKDISFDLGGIGIKSFKMQTFNYIKAS